MKHALTILLVGIVMFGIGLVSGSSIQKSKAGYHYQLLERKEYPSELGTIEWSSFQESVGTPFILDPEKTMINLGNRTIYKAQRDFQENAPRARNIEISGNLISWEDGDFQYRLAVNPMNKDKTSLRAK
jgi:hypothetical protein